MHFPNKYPPPTSGELIKVAKYYWPGEYWIEIADQKGFFEKAGLNVELIDTNSDYYQSLQDTVDGKIDVNNFPIFDLISYNINGADLVMIVNADTSYGSEAIIARQDIKTLDDLIGKKIAVSSGFYTDYILDIVLGEKNIKDKVTKVEITEDQNDEKAPEEFEKESFDAVITWEPVASKVVKKGGHIIWDTSEIPGISPNGQVFHKSFIEQRPKDVQAYVNVWHKTTQFIKENPDEAFGIIAEIYNVPVEEVAAFAKQDKILDLRDNEIAFTYAAGFESLHGTARQINNFMIDKGITNKRLDSIEFIDSQFIKNVK